MKKREWKILYRSAEQVIHRQRTRMASMESCIARLEAELAEKSRRLEGVDVSQEAGVLSIPATIKNAMTDADVDDLVITLQRAMMKPVRVEWVDENGEAKPLDIGQR